MCHLIWFTFILKRRTWPFQAFFDFKTTSQLSCTIITAVTTDIRSGWAVWPLFVIPKPQSSQSMQARWNLQPFLIFTCELMIPLWPSKFSTWCNRGWCIVLVGNWSWWLTQCDTWFHSLIAAPSWIGHKPTETYWPWWKWKKGPMPPHDPFCHWNIFVRH